MEKEKMHLGFKALRNHILEKLLAQINGNLIVKKSCSPSYQHW